jgi:hypothetical protein
MAIITVVPFGSTLTRYTTHLLHTGKAASHCFFASIWTRVEAGPTDETAGGVPRGVLQAIEVVRHIGDKLLGDWLLAK